MPPHPHSRRAGGDGPRYPRAAGILDDNVRIFILTVSVSWLSWNIFQANFSCWIPAKGQHPIARSIVYFHKRRELTREGGLFAISKYDVDLLFAAHFYFPIRICLDLVFATSHEIQGRSNLKIVLIDLQLRS